MGESTREIMERHHVRQRKKKRRLAFFMTLMFVSILVLTTFLALMMTPLCNVRKVKVSGNNRVANEAVVNTLAVGDATKVYQIDKRLAEKRILTLPYVKEVQIKTYIWGSVDVKITESEIGGYIMYNGNAVLFDETGKVVNITGEIPGDVLRIEGCNISSASAGEKISIDTSEKFDIMLMYISEFKTSEILNKMTMLDISDTMNVKGIYENRFDVFFGDFSDMEHKTAMLKQAIAHNAENEMGTIDLRIANSAYVKPDRSFVTTKFKTDDKTEADEKDSDAENKVDKTSGANEQTADTQDEKNQKKENDKKKTDDNKDENADDGVSANDTNEEKFE